MQSTTRRSFCQLNPPPDIVVPTKKPTSAKGIAKMVWLNFTSEKKFFIGAKMRRVPSILVDFLGKLELINIATFAALKIRIKRF